MTPPYASILTASAASGSLKLSFAQANLLTRLRVFSHDLPSEMRRPFFFTRLDAEVFAKIDPDTAGKYNFDPLSRTAWNAVRPRRPGVCAVVSAGSADAPVVMEAARTLEYLGYEVKPFIDCGVAGLWRIEAALPEINACDAVICAAGLDAALASVLGGLTMRPLFAVPTSIGYGIAQGGETALRSMLASCAPGVAVLNIDNGYGAACAAARVLAAFIRRRRPKPPADPFFLFRFGHHYARQHSRHPHSCGL